MPLTRNDVCTLDEAVRLYGVDEGWLPVFEEELAGKELRHLGEQQGGWFYEVADVQAIQAELDRMREAMRVQVDTKA